MKTREKRIIVSLAFVLALGFGTQALALDELEVTGNDLVGAVDGGTSANDDATAVGQNSLNDNTVIGEVEVDKSTATQNGSENEAEEGSAAANNSSIAVGEVELDKSTNDSNNNNSNQDNSLGKTQVAVEVEDSFKDSSDNSNQDNTADSFNDKAEAEGDGIALVDSEEVIVTKDSFNGNIDEMEGGAVAATTGGTASMTDSFNVDASINTTTTADRGGIAVGGLASEDEIEVEITEDSYNNKAEEGSVAIYGDNEAEIDIASHNTINSDNETTTVTVGDVVIEVASSVLAGEVSANNLITTPSLTLTTGDNLMDNASVNSTGISVISQNSGIQSQVQQAVTVQYNQ